MMGLAGAVQDKVNPEIVDQVAKMVAAGATEQELVAMGIPEEVIRAAIAIVNEQAQGRMMQDEGVGLAQAQGLI